MHDRERDLEKCKVAISVPRGHVKRVKSALERRYFLNRTTKITAQQPTDADSEPCMIVPTTVPYTLRGPVETLMADLELQGLAITLLPYEETSANTISTTNPVIRGLDTALGELPHELLLSLNLSSNVLLTSFPSTYSFYKPMLLLPPNALTSPPWTTLLATHSPTSPLLQSIWEQLARSVGATHVAINAAIPLQHTSSTTSDSEPSNIFRSPTNLTPLYGDFGPKPTPERLAHPTASDFASTFWVSHVQNGIHQVWAPLYTMFSRGNMREKTRLLNLPSITSYASSPSTAVDLYAGVGYFAFVYRRAGMRKVLCWELNPWSIEGFRRGAAKNKWTTQVFAPDEMPAIVEECAAFPQRVQDVDFLVFQQSNEETFRTLAMLHPQGLGMDALPAPLNIPPVRHINCGFLPSSKLSWRTAVKIVDREMGGWVHVHENVGTGDIEDRKVEVVAEMQSYLNAWESERGPCGLWVRRVQCEHVERVKTYAPGVVHVVFDVWVGGYQNRQILI